MRKAMSRFMLILATFALFGCAKNAEPVQTAQVVNPVHESTAVEIFEKLGIQFHIPKDAKNVSYFTIDVGEGKAMAQAKFTRSNVEYTHRIQPKASFEDISGAYFKWETIKKVEVSYCSGELRYNKGKQGICLWYDAVPGLMYSVYMGQGAAEETLLSLANELFVPAKDVK
jgi:hypothetical protein